MTQLTIADRFELHSMPRLKRFVGNAKRRANQTASTFWQEINPPANNQNRFYVPQRHF